MISPQEMALSKAKIALISSSKFCFYANIAMRLRYEFTEDVRYAAVNGTTMFLNPRFWMESLTPGKRVTTLLHEIQHIVRMHITRRGNRDPQLYNKAGDYVINLDLKDSGCEVLEWECHIAKKPTKWLLDERFRDMSTEAVYDILDSEKPPKMELDMDDLMPGMDIDGNPMDQGQVEAAVTEMIVSAVTAARMQGHPGSIPGDIQVFVDGLLQPKLPLAHLLRRFFKTAAGRGNGHTWTRPNRRYAGRFYLPSPKGKQLLHLAFAYDMSGSVSDADTKRYQSEVAGVIRELKPSKVTLVLFDTKIISTHEVKSVNELIQVKLTGRGGTSIHPLMKWAKEEQPHAMCVLSDGEFDMPHINPGMPVMWLIHGRGIFNPPFGSVTPFEV